MTPGPDDPVLMGKEIGNGCETDLQKSPHPFGRMRLIQFIARTIEEGRILQWLCSHSRAKRQRATWRLLVAGWRSLQPDAGRRKSSSRVLWTPDDILPHDDADDDEHLDGNKRTAAFGRNPAHRNRLHRPSPDESGDGEWVDEVFSAAGSVAPGTVIETLPGSGDRKTSGGGQ